MKIIRKLRVEDVLAVSAFHKDNLSGFLSTLGKEFLQGFYIFTLSDPLIFTIVSKEKGKIVGVATGALKTGRLLIKIVKKNPKFLIVLIFHLVKQPLDIIKLFKLLFYPGFLKNSSELLTIAVKKGLRGKGIGKALFKRSVLEFKRRGRSYFLVSTYAGARANGFYKKMGCEFFYSFPFIEGKMNYYKYEISENK